MTSAKTVFPEKLTLAGPVGLGALASFGDGVPSSYYSETEAWQGICGITTVTPNGHICPFALLTGSS